jgi:hypothetical protein
MFNTKCGQHPSAEFTLNNESHIPPKLVDIAGAIANEFLGEAAGRHSR